MSDDAQTVYERGRALFDVQQNDEALAAFRCAVDLAPDNMEYVAWLAYALACQKQPDDAIRLANVVLARDPDRYMAYLARGRVAEEQGRTAQMLDDYARAARLAPNDERPHRLYGEAAYDDGQYATAVKAFSTSLGLLNSDDKRRVWLLTHRADASRLLEPVDYAAALSDLEHAIALDPNNAMAHAVRGYICAKRKQWGQAIAALDTALNLEPSVTGWYAKRGKVHEALGDRERALLDYARSRMPDEWHVWSGEKHEFDLWYKRLNELMSVDMDLVLKMANERLVQYWPVYLLWGQETKYRQDVTGKPRVYSYEGGTFGTGMLLLSNRSVHLVSDAELTKRFPFIKRGAVDFMAGALLGAFDNRQPAKQDVDWHVPFDDLLGAEVLDNGQGNRRVTLVTAAMRWEVYEHFSGHTDWIMAGLNLARRGKLAHLFDQPAEAPTTPPAPPAAAPPAPPVVAPSDAILRLLQQLGELKAAGVLTEAEFEAKKAELLRRL